MGVNRVFFFGLFVNLKFSSTFIKRGFKESDLSSNKLIGSAFNTHSDVYAADCAM